MTQHLVVIKPFLNFKRGDVISDTSRISTILAAEYKKSVVSVATVCTAEG